MAGKSIILNELNKNQILVFLIPNDKYSESMIDISKLVSKKFNNLCYITLNKPFDTITLLFKENKINTDKFFFIDGATSGFKEPKDVLDVVFISSPKSLTELNININKIINKRKIPIIIFDSLSTLLVYEQPSTVIKFTHSVISSMRTSKVKCIFTALEKDIESELIKDLGMFVDRIVKLK